jgi:hypothetical protein
MREAICYASGMTLFKLARFASVHVPGAGAAHPTPRQKRTALVIAGIADVLQIALAPLFGEGALSPFDALLDVLAAGALLLALGRSWRIALALALELIPGAALFPTWTAVVATMSTARQPLEAAAIVTSA